MLKHLKITISGAPITGKNLDLFEKYVLDKMSKSTTKPSVERYNFARLNFRYVFTAENLDMNKIDTLHLQLMRLTKEYIFRWKYKININYTEQEKD